MPNELGPILRVLSPSPDAPRSSECPQPRSDSLPTVRVFFLLRAAVGRACLHCFGPALAAHVLVAWGRRPPRTFLLIQATRIGAAETIFGVPRTSCFALSPSVEFIHYQQRGAYGLRGGLRRPRPANLIRVIPSEGLSRNYQRPSARRGICLRAVIFANGVLENAERAPDAAQYADLILSAYCGALHCLLLDISPALLIAFLYSFA